MTLRDASINALHELAADMWLTERVSAMDAFSELFDALLAEGADLFDLVEERADVLIESERLRKLALDKERNIPYDD